MKQIQPSEEVNDMNGKKYILAKVAVHLELLS